MSDALAPPEACTPEPGSDADVRWELDSLKALGDLGLRLARATVAEAEARAAAPQADPARAPDPALAFSRIARAVRLSVMLHARVRDGSLGPALRAGEAAAPLPDEPETLDPEAAAALADRRLTGRLRRSMAHYIAGAAIEALDREAPERERLVEALDARLAREDQDDADFAEVDVKALAVSVCKDLAVDPGSDWWEDGWGIEGTAGVSPASPAGSPRSRNGATDAGRQSTGPP